MNLDGRFDYSFVEVPLRALRVLRGRLLVLLKNLLTTKHTESTKWGCVPTPDPDTREEVETERRPEKELGWGFSLSSSASSALSAFQTLCIAN